MLRLIIITKITLILTATNLNCQEYKVKIIDSITLLPIPNVIIAIGKNIVATTNAIGNFKIKNQNNINTYVNISHTGYNNKIISFKKVLKKKTIYLYPKIVLLKNIDIYSIDTLCFILRKAISNQKINYPNFSTNEYFFYEASEFKNNKKIALAQGLINVKKEKYFKRKNNKTKIFTLYNETKRDVTSNIDNNIKIRHQNFLQLFKTSETFISICNEFYFLSYLNFNKKHFKIEFTPNKRESSKKYLLYDGYALI